MVAIGAILSFSIFAPTIVCAQQSSMQQAGGAPQYSQTTGAYYQGGASAAVARTQQAWSQAYPYPAAAPQPYPPATPQNYQAQQMYPAEQPGISSQQNYPAPQQGYPAQQGYPTQEASQDQNYTTQQRTYVQGAESPAYQAAETPYEAQERAIQQARSQFGGGQSKIDTPAAEAMLQEQSQPPNMRGKVAKTGMSGAMRTAGRIMGRTALVALPVTAIVLLSRSATTSAMPMMAPSMGMMPRMGYPGMGYPSMGFGMPGMRVPMGTGLPMGMRLPNLLNGLH